MNPGELYLDNELKKHISIETKHIDGHVSKKSIDTDELNATDELQFQEDYIYSQLDSGKAEEIKLINGNDTIAEFQLSPLHDLQKEIDAMERKIDEIDTLEKRFEKSDELLERYELTKENYNNKLGAIENTINEKFGLISNSIHKKKGTESIIKPEVFQEIEKKIRPSIRKFFKEQFKYLYQSKNHNSPAAIQNVNNTLNAKLRLRENLMNELGNTKTTSNPDLMAEELLALLIKPVIALEKGLRNYSKEKKELNAKQLNTTKKVSPGLDKVNIKIDPKSNINIEYQGKAYSFQGYTQDYNGVLLADLKTKESFRLNNNMNYMLKSTKSISLSEIQKDLLKRGTSLMITNGVKNPFKIQQDKLNANYLNITTVTSLEFKNQHQVMSKSNNKSISQNL